MSIGRSFTMNEQKKKMELLGSAPISKALLAMGVPTMIGMLVNALYNLADTYFVGGLGTDQMGAVTVAFPLGQVIVGLGLLFGNGAAAYLSRLLGRGDHETADKAASTANLLQYCRWSHRHSRFHYLFKSHPEGDRCHKQRHALCHRLYAHLYHFFYF